MPKVRFLRERLEIEVAIGTTVLEAAKAAGAPEGDRCGGVCACSTCHVYVMAGFDRLSDVEDEEFDILDRAFDVRPSSRLGCQARIHGDVDVEIAQESVQAYCDEHPEQKARVLALRG
jgi:ferredoxin